MQDLTQSDCKRTGALSLSSHLLGARIVVSVRELAQERTEGEVLEQAAQRIGNELAYEILKKYPVSFLPLPTLGGVVVEGSVYVFSQAELSDVLRRAEAAGFDKARELSTRLNPGYSPL